MGRGNVRRVRASVLLVHTNLQPENKAFLHLVAIAGGKARIGNEVDEWRLLDLNANTVTFVDDITRTYRTRSFAALMREKRAALTRPIPEHVPRAEFITTEERRSFGPFAARLFLVRMGGYQRSLWMSTALNVPSRLFPLMVASDPAATPYAPAMSQVFEELTQLGGFPVIDRGDVTWAGEPRMIEKKLIRVEQRNVPAFWVEVPAGYRNLDEQANPGRTE